MSALDKQKVDSQTAYWSGVNPEGYTCPHVEKLQDLYGRPLDSVFQYYGYGDVQRNVACIPNDLVTDMKDQQRAFALMNAPQPAAIRSEDGTYKNVGGGFNGIPLGNPFYDYLSGKGRDFAIPNGLRPLYAIDTAARPGVDEMQAWMDTNAKKLQQRNAPVDFVTASPYALWGQTAPPPVATPVAAPVAAPVMNTQPPRRYQLV